ncbi:hypothetical protein CCB80_06625 [Armatimonadetes bacterium Uphvl-Ar1]|nr:hypothetical protein CCB80_06625 [Armatimonadetes bacterium Uphvl-Ar1]
MSKFCSAPGRLNSYSVLFGAGWFGIYCIRGFGFCQARGADFLKIATILVSTQVVPRVVTQ